MKILSLDYYQQEDVLFLSRDLLGKVLFTQIDNKITAGKIIETEAYRGPEDRASHAFGNRRTKRNEVMYHAGGTSYVYQCYGLHFLFNVVTNKTNIPHAILIRAIEPLEGVTIMLERRKKGQIDRTLTSGPGTLAQALGINRAHNGISLHQPPIWIEESPSSIPEEQILASPRVGVEYAKEDALLPWRFRLKNSVWTS